MGGVGRGGGVLGSPPSLFWEGLESHDLSNGWSVFFYTHSFLRKSTKTKMQTEVVKTGQWEK